MFECPDCKHDFGNRHSLRLHNERGCPMRGEFSPRRHYSVAPPKKSSRTPRAMPKKKDYDDDAIPRRHSARHLRSKSTEDRQQPSSYNNRKSNRSASEAATSHTAPTKRKKSRKNSRDGYADKNDDEVSSWSRASNDEAAYPSSAASPKGDKMVDAHFVFKNTPDTTSDVAPRAAPFATASSLAPGTYKLSLKSLERLKISVPPSDINVAIEAFYMFFVNGEYILEPFAEYSYAGNQRFVHPEATDRAAITVPPVEFFVHKPNDVILFTVHLLNRNVLMNWAVIFAEHIGHSDGLVYSGEQRIDLGHVLRHFNNPSKVVMDPSGAVITGYIEPLILYDNNTINNNNNTAREHTQNTPPIPAVGDLNNTIDELRHLVEELLTARDKQQPVTLPPVLNRPAYHEGTQAEAHGVGVRVGPSRPPTGEVPTTNVGVNTSKASSPTLPELQSRAAGASRPPTEASMHSAMVGPSRPQTEASMHSAMVGPSRPPTTEASMYSAQVGPSRPPTEDIPKVGAGVQAHVNTESHGFGPSVPPTPRRTMSSKNIGSSRPPTVEPETANMGVNTSAPFSPPLENRGVGPSRPPTAEVSMHNAQVGSSRPPTEASMHSAMVGPSRPPTEASMHSAMVGPSRPPTTEASMYSAQVGPSRPPTEEVPKMDTGVQAHVNTASHGIGSSRPPTPTKETSNKQMGSSLPPTSAEDKNIGTSFDYMPAPPETETRAVGPSRPPSTVPSSATNVAHMNSTSAPPNIFFPTDTATAAASPTPVNRSLGEMRKSGGKDDVNSSVKSDRMRQACFKSETESNEPASTTDGEASPYASSDIPLPVNKKSIISTSNYPIKPAKAKRESYKPSEDSSKVPTEYEQDSIASSESSGDTSDVAKSFQVQNDMENSHQQTAASRSNYPVKANELRKDSHSIAPSDSRAVPADVETAQGLESSSMKAPSVSNYPVKANELRKDSHSIVPSEHDTDNSTTYPSESRVGPADVETAQGLEASSMKAPSMSNYPVKATEMRKDSHSIAPSESRVAPADVETAQGLEASSMKAPSVSNYPVKATEMRKDSHSIVPSEHDTDNSTTYPSDSRATVEAAQGLEASSMKAPSVSNYPVKANELRKDSHSIAPSESRVAPADVETAQGLEASSMKAPSVSNYPVKATELRKDSHSMAATERSAINDGNSEHENSSVHGDSSEVDDTDTSNSNTHTGPQPLVPGHVMQPVLNSVSSFTPAARKYNEQSPRFVAGEDEVEPSDAPVVKDRNGSLQSNRYPDPLRQSEIEFPKGDSNRGNVSLTPSQWKTATVDTVGSSATSPKGITTAPDGTPEAKNRYKDEVCSSSNDSHRENATKSTTEPLLTEEEGARTSKPFSEASKTPNALAASNGEDAKPESRKSSLVGSTTGPKAPNALGASNGEDAKPESRKSSLVGSTTDPKAPNALAASNGEDAKPESHKSSLVGSTTGPKTPNALAASNGEDAKPESPKSSAFGDALSPKAPSVAASNSEAASPRSFRNTSSVMEPKTPRSFANSSASRPQTGRKVNLVIGGKPFGSSSNLAESTAPKRQRRQRSISGLDPNAPKALSATEDSALLPEKKTPISKTILDALTPRAFSRKNSPDHGVSPRTPNAFGGSAGEVGKSQSRRGSAVGDSTRAPNALTGSGGEAGRSRSRRGSDVVLPRTPNALAGSDGEAGRSRSRRGSDVTPRAPNALAGSDGEAGRSRSRRGSDVTPRAPNALAGSDGEAGRSRSRRGSDVAPRTPNALTGSGGEAARSRSRRGSDVVLPRTPNALAGSDGEAGRSRSRRGSDVVLPRTPNALTGSGGEAGKSRSRRGSGLSEKTLAALAACEAEAAARAESLSRRGSALGTSLSPKTPNSLSRRGSAHSAIFDEDEVRPKILESAEEGERDNRIVPLVDLKALRSKSLVPNTDDDGNLTLPSNYKDGSKVNCIGIQSFDTDAREGNIAELIGLSPPGLTVKPGDQIKESVTVHIDSIVGVPFDAICTRVHVFILGDLSTENFMPRNIAGSKQSFLRPPNYTQYQTRDSCIYKPSFTFDFKADVGDETYAVVIIEYISFPGEPTVLGHCSLPINKKSRNGSYVTRVRSGDPRRYRERRFDRRSPNTAYREGLQAVEKYTQRLMEAALDVQAIRNNLTMTPRRRADYLPMCAMVCRIDCDDEKKPYRPYPGEPPLSWSEREIYNSWNQRDFSSPDSFGLEDDEETANAFDGAVTLLSDHVSFMSAYAPSRGGFVKVEGLRGLGRDAALYAVVMYCFPNGIRPKKLDRNSMMPDKKQGHVFATLVPDWESDVGAPRYLDHPFHVKGVPYSEHHLLFFTLLKIWPQDFNKGEPRAEAVAWTMTKMFMEFGGIIRQGRFALPWLSGAGPAAEFMEELHDVGLENVFPSALTSGRISYYEPRATLTITQGDPLFASHFLEDNPGMMQPMRLMIPDKKQNDFPCNVNEGVVGCMLKSANKHCFGSQKQLALRNSVNEAVLDHVTRVFKGMGDPVHDEEKKYRKMMQSNIGPSAEGDVALSKMDCRMSLNSFRIKD